MKLLIAVISIFIAAPVYAQAHDMRISDGNGYVLTINTDGSLPIKAGTPTYTAGGSKDKRISDSSGNVLGVNADHTVTVTFQ